MGKRARRQFSELGCEGELEKVPIRFWRLNGLGVSKGRWLCRGGWGAVQLMSAARDPKDCTGGAGVGRAAGGDSWLRRKARAANPGSGKGCGPGCLFACRRRHVCGRGALLSVVWRHTLSCFGPAERQCLADGPGPHGCARLRRGRQKSLPLPARVPGPVSGTGKLTRQLPRWGQPLELLSGLCSTVWGMKLAHGGKNWRLGQDTAQVGGEEMEREPGAEPGWGWRGGMGE